MSSNRLERGTGWMFDRALKDVNREEIGTVATSGAGCLMHRIVVAEVVLMVGDGIGATLATSVALVSLRESSFVVCAC